MPRQEPRWVRISGDGLVYLGPGWLVDLVYECSGQGNQLNVYDGQDAGSGRRLFRVFWDNDRPFHAAFWPGYRFEVGIYIDQSVADDWTVVNYQPDLPERV